MTVIVRVIDFETTGTELPEAEVCEVGHADVDVVGRTVTNPHSYLCAVDRMPPEARAVHHISLSDCATSQKFDPARLRDDHIGYFAAHNAEFETKFFTPDVPMICTYKAALRIWPDAPAHNNGTLRYWLEDQGKIAPVHEYTRPAHRAGPDAYVTGHVLLALLAAGASGRDMVAWTREPALLPRCPIGKFRGRPWAEVDAGFLDWMLRQADMDEALKWNAGRELDRRRAVQ
jgi:exodeoxyribonuclease X